MAKERTDDELYTVSEEGCWEFVGSKSHNGYGQMKRKGVHVRAHRYFYERYVSPIKDSMLVLHKCDNRSCVNPSHLELGYQQKNIQDAASRGRLKPRYGEKHPRSIFSDKDVLNMRNLYQEGKTQAYIAGVYNTYQATVSSIVRGLKRKRVCH